MEAGGAGTESKLGAGSKLGTESALMRAQMLALGLSRSSTSSQSTRRLRLLKAIELSH